MPNEGIYRAGALSMKELTGTPGCPSKERLKLGAVAVIECLQEIPCNPCEEACPYGAIIVGEPITNLPVLNADVCRGCGACLAVCPGLAIFIVDTTLNEGNASVSFPFEYFPLPLVGDEVDAVDRSGNVVVGGVVLQVKNPKKNDRTPVVTIRIPKVYAMEVRGIVLPKRKVIVDDGPQ